MTRALSQTTLELLADVRGAALLRPLLRFELDAEPAAAAGGFRVGTLRDGTPLLVTPGRRAWVLEGEGRVRLGDWLVGELETAERAIEAMDAAQALELLGNPSTADELVAKLPLSPIVLGSEDELLALLGAYDEHDEHLDEAPKLEDWLPEGVSAAELRAATLLEDDEHVTRWRVGDGFLELSRGEARRLNLLEASVAWLGAPHLEALRSEGRGLRGRIHAPWNAWTLVGACLVASPFSGLGSVVAGVAVAGLIAVVGFALSTAGVAIPEPPSVSWLIGAPSVALFVVANVVIAEGVARD